MAALAEVVQAVRIPVIAVGGIDAHTMEPVMAAGARGIDVISAILNAPSSAQVTATLRQTLDRWA